jgi:hypothetical protein
MPFGGDATTDYEVGAWYLDSDLAGITWADWVETNHYDGTALTPTGSPCEASISERPDGILVMVCRDNATGARGLAAGTGIATSSGISTLSDSSKAWTTNAYAGFQIVITSGAGEGQYRYIDSNTNTQLTVSVAWATQPNSTSTYQICEHSHAIALTSSNQGETWENMEFTDWPNPAAPVASSLVGNQIWTLANVGLDGYTTVSPTCRGLLVAYKSEDGISAGIQEIVHNDGDANQYPTIIHAGQRLLIVWDHYPDGAGYANAGTNSMYVYSEYMPLGGSLLRNFILFRD